MDRLKTEAEHLRLGVRGGWLGVEHAVEWADSQIARSSAPHLALLDVALARTRSLTAVKTHRIRQREPGRRPAPGGSRRDWCSRRIELTRTPRVRFHDLRHSAASLLIASGVELVEVSQLLGHSELRVTADLYGHLQKQTAAKAATIMDGVLGG